MMESIVVSGPPGVGKSTLARLLADDLSMAFLDGGDVLKQLARSMGFNTGGDDWWDQKDGMAFLKLRSKDDSFDRKVDETMLERFEAGGMVCTSYTMPWLANSGTRLWLDGTTENIAKRIGGRDNTGYAEAHSTALERFEKNAALYKKLYGFDYAYDSDVFDARIDTNNSSIWQVLQAAKKCVLEKRPVG